MNQWKIVWLPVWINSDLLLEVVLYLVRVAQNMEKGIEIKILACPTRISLSVTGERNYTGDIRCLVHDVRTSF